VVRVISLRLAGWLVGWKRRATCRSRRVVSLTHDRAVGVIEGQLAAARITRECHRRVSSHWTSCRGDSRMNWPDTKRLTDASSRLICRGAAAGAAAETYYDLALWERLDRLDTRAAALSQRRESSRVA